MYCVPAFCQFLAQLRANYAAASVGGINRDANVHKPEVRDQMSDVSTQRLVVRWLNDKSTKRSN